MTPRKTPNPGNPAEVARTVGLRYVTDGSRGLRRERQGELFVYIDPEGNRLRDPETLRRITALAIPPAWTEVWICPLAGGHLQATGRDARGRKQYRYHRRWREIRDETKFNRMIAFGKTLPRIRKRVADDLAGRGLGRNRVLAAIVRLMELSAIRVGNEEYARQNNSYGLTTLQDRHAAVRGTRIRFRFRGKGGKQHEVDIDHPSVARIVKRCRDLPGQDLFQYVDEKGMLRDVTSGDVNAYLAEVAGSDFTAKDFRTWIGTVLAAVALREFEQIDSDAKAKKNILRAIERVAQRLGNTPSICRKCYIHPAVFESYLDGTLARVVGREAADEVRRSLHSLSAEEAAVLLMLQRRLQSRDPERLDRNLARSVAAIRRKKSRRKSDAEVRLVTPRNHRRLRAGKTGARRRA